MIDVVVVNIRATGVRCAISIWATSRDADLISIIGVRGGWGTKLPWKLVCFNTTYCPSTLIENWLCANVIAGLTGGMILPREHVASLVSPQGSDKKLYLPSGSSANALSKSIFNHALFRISYISFAS